MHHDNKARMDSGEPLDYGRTGRSPDPGDLLSRGSACLFQTLDEAKAALNESLDRAIAKGDEYPKTHWFSFVRVYGPGDDREP
jgi:hypothetical protein